MFGESLSTEYDKNEDKDIVKVESVSKDSPAQKAGIKNGAGTKVPALFFQKETHMPQPTSCTGRTFASSSLAARETQWQG